MPLARALSQMQAIKIQTCTAKPIETHSSPPYTSRFGLFHTNTTLQDPLTSNDMLTSGAVVVAHRNNVSLVNILHHRSLVEFGVAGVRTARAPQTRAKHFSEKNMYSI